DSAAARARAFIAASERLRRRYTDSLSSVGKTGTGSVFAWAQFFGSSGERPYRAYAVPASPGYGAWKFALRCEGITDAAARRPAHRPDTARALSVQGNERDGDA